MCHFYPRSPCGERPRPVLGAVTSPAVNFYPRSPCGERLDSLQRSCERVHISIHALLAESDRKNAGLPTGICTFLSTLSLRRATVASCRAVQVIDISIHALLAESDRQCRHNYARHDYFYPRSPCGERHKEAAEAIRSMVISIHALLAESDKLRKHTPRWNLYFYPRSPCGERLGSWPRAMILLCLYFYPRSPCGERRDARRALGFVDPISIHALLAESDLLFACPFL